MKKRVISVLAIAALLLASIAVPCVADTQQDLEASVTVSEYISITIADANSDGINFGTLTPGTDNNTEAAQDAVTPAVTITVESDSNTNVDLEISGTDFDVTFTIDNALYALAYDGTQAAMSTTDTEFASDLAPGATQDIWHWLDVPVGVTAGAYGSTFSYKAKVHD